MLSLNIFLFLCIYSAYCSHIKTSVFKYNTRYCISLPHYLAKSIPPVSTNIQGSQIVDPSTIPYVIPDYIFKKVFPQNLPTKKYR